MSYSTSYLRSSYLGNCLGPMESSGLSGIPETVFAVRIGTAPEYAETLADAITHVYVRANYNRNISAGRGSLPAMPTVYYSRALVQAVMDRYRKLSGTGTVQHLTPETINTSVATDVYQQVSSSLMANYPALTLDTAKHILREWFQATMDGKIKPVLLLPAAQRYPTPGSEGMFTMDEERRKVSEEKAELQKETFLGRIGAAAANLLGAPGELASAATTTAKVAGVGVVVVGLGALGALSWAVIGKLRQLDVNRAYHDSQVTARKVGPGALRLAATKGLAA